MLNGLVMLAGSRPHERRMTAVGLSGEQTKAFAKQVTEMTRFYTSILSGFLYFQSMLVRSGEKMNVGLRSY